MGILGMAGKVRLNVLMCEQWADVPHIERCHRFGEREPGRDAKKDPCNPSGPTPWRRRALSQGSGGLWVRLLGRRAQRAVFLAAVFLTVAFFTAAFFTVFLAAAFFAGAALAAAVFLAGAFLAAFFAVVRTARLTGLGAASSLVKGARAWSSSLAKVACSLAAMVPASVFSTASTSLSALARIRLPAAVIVVSMARP